MNSEFGIGTANGDNWEIYLKTFFESIRLDDHFLPDTIDFLYIFIFFVIFLVRVQLPPDKVFCETFDKLGLDFQLLGIAVFIGSVENSAFLFGSREKLDYPFKKIVDLIPENWFPSFW